VRSGSRAWNVNLSRPASRLITAGGYLLSYLLVTTGVQERLSCSPPPRKRSRGDDEESEEEAATEEEAEDADTVQ